MTASERWQWIVGLDDRLLKGDVVLPGWCTTIVKEADLAYAHGANLAAILTAVAGVESYLRSEDLLKSKKPLAELIDHAFLPRELKARLHRLRKYRNNWVHVDDPWDDEELLEHPEAHEAELDEMARKAIVLLRETIYSTQGV